MSEECAKCGYLVAWCRCRSADHTWTLFVRLWRGVGREAARARKWSEAHLRELLIQHPLPWHVDQDWTWEVVDARDSSVESGFTSWHEADQYIEAARKAAQHLLTDAQLRELYARYCECRDIDGAVNTARLTHSHDCYCDVLVDIRTALHGFLWMDGEPIAVSDATRAAARERLVTAWRDYEEEAAHLGRLTGYRTHDAHD